MQAVSVKAEIDRISSSQLHEALGIGRHRRAELLNQLKQCCPIAYKRLGFTGRQKSWTIDQKNALLAIRRMYLPRDRDGWEMVRQEVENYLKAKGLPC